ncbi:MAG: chromosomal replication initiator protein DnaA [Clostridia bacterium]|nr:chromosomal replication initiator protein DnaA [Clostridia bacterium]MBQ8340504.1 chromosomal replication initiator protein DnaA [Clostridia bacterium]MBQ8912318.1 chromosomal replication initiator protein DnaA [Clostridia bacterium]
MACPEEMLSLWELVKESFRKECAVEIFNLWYNDITPIDYQPDGENLIFSATSEFKLKYLTEKYKPLIENRFSTLVGMDLRISFVCKTPNTTVEELKKRFSPVEEATPAAETPSPAAMSAENAQRAKYTFDNFIVGEANKFARAACWKVANNPSNEWNPLFLYGPSGVGKTHLMCAVINELRRQNPSIKVVYIKGDDFINDMVKCLAHSNMESFRARYRGCDVLLIDDIQFIAGKEATQLEVFNTFQTLFDDGKQIILASDRPPKDINPLEERLRSRFEQGLLADINPPDLELRVAIIRKKAETLSIDLPDDVLTFIAENLRSNIRQIEGAIKKLAAKSLVEGRMISMELAKDCVTDLWGNTEPLNVTIDKIFAAVFKKFDIQKEELVGKKRNKEIANARHIVIYLIREITEMSYPNISKIFERDHATIMASIEVVKKRISSDPLYAMDIEGLRKEICGS